MGGRPRRGAPRWLAASLAALLALPLLAGLAFEAKAQTLPLFGLLLGDFNLTVAEDAGSVEVTVFQGLAATTSQLTVTYGIGGTATCGTDYTIAGADCAGGTGSFTVPSGSQINLGGFTALTIMLTDDSASDSGETIVLTLQAGTGYTAGAAAATITIIEDSGPAAFSLTGEPHIGETLSLTKTADDPDGNGTFRYVWSFRATSSDIWDAELATNRGCTEGATTCTPTHTTQHPTLGGEFLMSVFYQDGAGLNYNIAVGMVGPFTWPPPAGLTATPGDGQVTLAWTDPMNPAIDKYQYRQRTGTTGTWGDWTDIPSSGATATTHTVTSLTNGTQYSFQVRAVDGTTNGNGAASNTATATPAQKTTLVGNTGEDPVVNLVRIRIGTKFTTGASGAGYTVSSVGVSLRTATAGPVVTIRADGTNPTGAVVATLTAPAAVTANAVNTYTAPANTVLAANTTYWLRVDATPSEQAVTTSSGNQTGATGWSIANGGRFFNSGQWGITNSILQFAINGQAVPTPDAPTNLSATPGSGQVTLSWADPSDSAIDKYQYRQGTGSPLTWGSWRDIPNSGADTTSHTVAGLTNGTAYSFQVRAVDGSRNGTASAIVAATPDLLLVGNTGEAIQTDSSTSIGTKFTTGASGGGYTVSSVGVSLGAATAAPVVTIRADGTNPTGAVVATLTAPATVTANAVNTYTAPASTVLAANTTYWLRVDASDANRANVAGSGNETGATGWSIAAGSRSLGSGTWTSADTAGSPLRFAINGQAVTAPDAPTSLAATVDNAQVTLSWADPSNGAITKYQFRQRAGTGGSFGSWTDIASSDAETTSHMVTGLANGTAYGFQVRAVAGTLEGAASATVTATPFPPLVSNTGESPSITGRRVIGTKFTTGANAAGYTVSSVGVRLGAATAAPAVTIRADGENPTGTVVATLTAPATVTANAVNTYTAPANTVLAASTTYWLRVDATVHPVGLADSVNETGATGWSIADENRLLAVGWRRGSPSDPLQFTINGEANPPAPTSLTATAGSGQVTLSWADPSNSAIDKYQYRQGTGSPLTWGSWTDIPGSGADTTSHTVTGLTNGTAYSFEVRVVAVPLLGAASAIVAATPMVPPVTVSLDSAALTVTEGDDTHAVFTLRLSAPRATATAVTVVTIGTGASENSDFVPGPFTVTIDAGKTEATLRIEILDDNFDVNDDDETFNVIVNPGSLPAGVVPGTPSRATVTITDDDAPPPAPAGLTAEAGDGRVVLAWTYAPPEVDRTSGFEYRARAGTAAWGAWTAVPGGAGRRGHTVTGLANGIEHTFEVRARTRNGAAGLASSQATATPDSEASVLAAEARTWISEDSCDTDCGDRLRRAIKALGGSGDDLAGVVPLTYREAEALAFTNTDMVWRERWGEVAKALRGLEADRTRVSIEARTAGPVAEGAELTFRLTASEAPAADLAVSVAVEDVQASPGAQRVSDFVADAVREVVIPADQATAEFTVQTVDDGAQEPGGFVNATLRGSLDYAPGARWGASVEVADNDAGGAPVPVVGVSGGPSVTEGGNAEFTLRAVPAPDSPLAVSVTIAQDGDFAASGQTVARTVTIGTGGAATFTVGTEDDAIDEEDGAIRAAVSAGEGYTVGDAEASVAVVDNDGDPPTPPSTTFTPNSDLVEEIQQWRGETQHGQEHIDRWTRVLIALGVETGSDLEPMPSGEAQGYADRGWTRWVDVVTELKLKEAHDAQPVTPVTPPPALPTVTVAGDGAVTEGAGAAFTVSRTGGTAEALTVLLAVSEDTSGGRDFVAADDEGNKQVVIQAGSATATLTVPTTADSVDEPDGTVTLALRTSSAYTRGAPSSGTVAVSDDDGATPPPPPVLPAITVAAAADGPVTEGGTLSFTLRASAAPAADLTVSYKVADAAGGDFVASGGEGQRTAVIAAGQTSVDVTVATTADSTDEPDGQVAVTVAAGEGYTVGTPATAETAVADDDATTVTLSGPSGDIAEAGGAKTFTVMLGRAPVAGEWVRVPLMLGGAATRSADWTATCAQAPGVRCFGLNSSDRPSIDFFFATGEGASTTARVTLTAVADSVDEGAGETVTVALGTPETNASGGATGTGTLGFTISDDDDPLPAVSAEAGAGVTEGMDAVFTLTVSPAPAAADLTVSYTVADADGADFLLRASEGANTVVIGAGATSASVTVPTVADLTDEPDGEVTLTLAAGAGYRLGTASATVMVSDDDATAGPTLSISDAQVAEGGNMPFTITLSAPSRERVCFDARTRDSTPRSATAGTDYTPNLWNAGRYLPCFRPGHTALRLWIKTWKDAHDESDETFEMVLSNPRGATIADAVGVGTICDRNNTAQCPPVETDTDVLQSPDGFAAGGLAAEPAAEPQTGPGPRARSAPRLEPRFEPPAAACVPPELLSEVRAHAGASRRPAAAERWLRVLHTFTGAANDATIMLSAEARTYLDPGRPEWAPVVAAIQCLEARAMR